MIRAVLFDLDGTFADTAPDLGYALNCMREARQLRWGIVTNKAERFAKPLLDLLQVGKRAACMRTVAVTYGYLNGSDPATWRANAVIQRPQELLSYL